MCFLFCYNDIHGVVVQLPNNDVMYYTLLIVSRSAVAVGNESNSNLKMADKERTESLQGHTVDLDKLRTELLAAKASEERYQRENDAKFRAIAQRVGSYEEFR